MTAPVLYVRDGSRFVPVDEARPAPRPVPPIPTPVHVDVETTTQEQHKPWRVAVHAPRCPHGRFRGCVLGCIRGDYR